MEEHSEPSKLEWEQVEHTGLSVPNSKTFRARVIGGWLVSVWAEKAFGGGLTFVPDPLHVWPASATKPHPGYEGTL